MTPITIACLDMAGTTVRDDGIVMNAFGSAISGRGLSPAEFGQAMKDVSRQHGPVQDRGLPPGPR